MSCYFGAFSLWFIWFHRGMQAWYNVDVSRVIVCPNIRHSPLGHAAGGDQVPTCVHVVQNEWDAFSAACKTLLMVLLCRFPGGPGVDDMTGLHIPPPQAHSRTSTLSSDIQPHDLHIWLFPRLTRSCQSHADVSSPPWDFGWRRGFSPARTRVMATFAG